MVHAIYVTIREYPQTMTLSQHLVSKYGQHELSTNKKENNSSSPSLDVNQKRQLNELIVNCIIHDSRTFSDFEKLGLRKLLKKAYQEKTSENYS